MTKLLHTSRINLIFGGPQHIGPWMQWQYMTMIRLTTIKVVDRRFVFSFATCKRYARKGPRSRNWWVVGSYSSRNPSRFSISNVYVQWFFVVLHGQRWVHTWIENSKLELVDSQIVGFQVVGSQVSGYSNLKTVVKTVVRACRLARLMSALPSLKSVAPVCRLPECILPVRWVLCQSSGEQIVGSKILSSSSS